MLTLPSGLPTTASPASCCPEHPWCLHVVMCGVHANGATHGREANCQLRQAKVNTSSNINARICAGLAGSTPPSIPGWPAGMPLPAGRMLSHAELAQQQGLMRPGAAVAGELPSPSRSSCCLRPAHMSAFYGATVWSEDAEQQFQSLVYHQILSPSLLLPFSVRRSLAHCGDRIYGMHGLGPEALLRLPKTLQDPMCRAGQRCVCPVSWGRPTACPGSRACLFRRPACPCRRVYLPACPERCRRGASGGRQWSMRCGPSVQL